MLSEVQRAWGEEGLVKAPLRYCGVREGAGGPGAAAPAQVTHASPAPSALPAAQYDKHALRSLAADDFEVECAGRKVPRGYPLGRSSASCGQRRRAPVHVITRLPDMHVTQAVVLRGMRRYGVLVAAPEPRGRWWAVVGVCGDDHQVL